MSMQAIIMAGGEGVRLRPLTYALPKPLAPLCGAPVMDYTLRLLARHHVRSATATLWYRPEDIKSAFGDGAHGVRLDYITETIKLGTAGSVLRAATDKRATTLVLSGDGLTNVDLEAALAFHRARGAAATMVLKHVDIPLAYGVVVIKEDGRIARFVEKPDWRHVVSSLVNTGVYLLEPEALALIPRDRPYDFGRELFPMMLEKGLPLYGYETDAYWCDVGSPAAFLQAQADLLQGKVGIAPADRGVGQIAGAEISDTSYVSPMARVETGAKIMDSCILPGAIVGTGAMVQGAIVCAGAQVGRGAEVRRGGVLGAGATAGAFSVLGENTRIWPGIAVPECTTVSGTIAEGTPTPQVSQGIARASTPAQLVHTAGAFVLSQRAQTVAVMHDGSALATYHMLLGALSAYGAQRVWALGRGSSGMLSYAATVLHTDGAMLATKGGVYLLDARGIYLSDKRSAEIAALLGRQETPAPTWENQAVCTHASLRSAYMQAMSVRYKPQRGVAVTLICRDRFLRALCREAMEHAGHSVTAQGEVTLAVTNDAAYVMDKQGMLKCEQQWQLRARALEGMGERVYDLEDWAVPGYTCAQADESDTCCEQQRLLQDGVRQALLLLTLFSRESVQEAVAKLPPLERAETDVACADADKGRVLEALQQKTALRAAGGLAVRMDGAETVICPDSVLPCMHVTAFATDSEQAKELCVNWEKEIRRLIHAGAELKR